MRRADLLPYDFVPRGSEVGRLIGGAAPSQLDATVEENLHAAEREVLLSQQAAEREAALKAREAELQSKLADAQAAMMHHDANKGGKANGREADGPVQNAACSCVLL